MTTAFAPRRTRTTLLAADAAPLLSIVLPAHNEAQRIQHAVLSVDGFLRSLRISYEIIVGDSASTDDTVAQALGSGVPHLRIVQVSAPGKGLILKRAMCSARGSLVGFLDSDLDIGVEYLEPAIRRVRAGADAVVASKSMRRRPHHQRAFIRRLASRVVNRIIQISLNSPLTDHQAGLKVFRRQALLPALLRVRTSGWLFDTELLAAMLADGARIEEIAVETRPHRPSRLRSARQCIWAISELIQVCAHARLQRWYAAHPSS